MTARRGQEQVLNTRTTNAPYSQTASQHERAQVLKQDIDALRRAVSPDVGPSVPVYPRLPASSPWSGGDPCGIEPPLFYSVEKR
jgi:hypothetical protein